MADARQESFKLLREPCVELSSVGLRFRGGHASAAEVLRAVTPLYRILQDLASKNALDRKLAEYAFFPLSHIFNETQRLPARCLEITVQCLHILIADGWREQLSPALAKQLIILLTLIVGGSPSNSSGQSAKAQVAEELSVACFDCLREVFDQVRGPVADETIFHEIGTATVVDQTVYLLLEAVVDDKSDALCISSAKSLKSLYARITDRVVLASIMPRTVSALAKVIRPTTQSRRSYRLLQTCLEILQQMIRAVLSDNVVENTAVVSANVGESDKLTLDASWLKATTTQIKLALVNVSQVRRHSRLEVQEALLNLCTMVIEDCQSTLKDAVPMMVETIVVLAGVDETYSNQASVTILHLATAYAIVLDSLKESLYTWLTSFPRIMQSSDETAKQWGIRQISTVFKILSQLQCGSVILSGSLASGLCDSMSAVVKHTESSVQPVSASAGLQWDVIVSESRSREFPSILLEHQSQQQTLKDMLLLVHQLNRSESGNEITRSIINRLHAGPQNSSLAPFWLALNALRAQSQHSAEFDDFIVDDSTEKFSSLASRNSMIEELYFSSLTILNEFPADVSSDWRLAALALEAVALQAKQQGEAFRPELIDALYPTLHLLASNNKELQRHAMICLNVLTQACNYTDTSTMIVENVDYLVNSVALKLNTFDVSPYPPQVLFMMVKLCGAKLVPYLDDLVDSIFGILDMYHGYPKLVEIMFKTLAAIVEEGTRKPSLLTIDNGREMGPHESRKLQYQNLALATVAKDIAKRKSRRAELAEADEEVDGIISHPQKPWSETYDKPKPEPETIEELLNQAESDEPLPPPSEPEEAEKPLSKTHNLLLHIVKSIPSHISSPSPHLRRSLLSMLIKSLPTLSQNENSFLPLINDLWHSVASRVIFPSSPSTMSSHLSTDKSLSSAEFKGFTTLSDSSESHEEIFVMTAACQTIEAMCIGAGDFMATRVETEFPRWVRLYTRIWSQVKRDAQAANERRARHQKTPKGAINISETTHFIGNTSNQALVLNPSLAISSFESGSRSYASHFTLWRSLISLFVTILSHVRLPLEAGDQICELLGSWVGLYVGPDFYLRGDKLGVEGSAGADKEVVESIDRVVSAMNTWNADLTWFIMAAQRQKSGPPRALQEVHTVEVEGEAYRFAAFVT
ncbi:hypothetical protein N7539_005617 [Penicillium diatomitis]|uniref:HEAT repeat protein n=1 Tax=Penicillium diatomitis TaxID=2819901 RepID=A0A9W9X7Q7_9EURO|nr:uncharacterized protein N7539_005617 [Penicillium diatomitis]KAJ5485629.1 hypothetical protein N7539_005617 [Penicillium diatomitis]